VAWLLSGHASHTDILRRKKFGSKLTVGILLGRRRGPIKTTMRRVPGHEGLDKTGQWTLNKKVVLKVDWWLRLGGAAKKGMSREGESRKDKNGTGTP